MTALRSAVEGAMLAEIATTRRVADPYVAPCPYCRGRGYVIESGHHGGTMTARCDACNGYGSKEGATIMIEVSR